MRETINTRGEHIEILNNRMKIRDQIILKYIQEIEEKQERYNKKMHKAKIEVEEVEDNSVKRYL